MRVNMDELKNLALSATPGPWKFLASDTVDDFDGRAKYCGAGNDESFIAICGDDYCQQSIADAKFISAVGPDVVAELIESQERFMELLVDLRAVIESAKFGLNVVAMLEEAIDKAELK